jgi:hypothetical protein
MAVFNRVKLQVDRARGIADPKRDPERTPTADAIQMRFKELTGRLVKWEELLDGALRTGRQRTMWLSALRRDEARADLTDTLVIHALRLVAARRGVGTLTRQQYDETRDALVAEDRERNGEDGLLERLLPTANQVLAHCELSWENALNLAGLQPWQQERSGHRQTQLNPVAGMPVAQVVAVYAALNGAWPSRATLLHFASSSGVRMADPTAPMAPVREYAAQLLVAEGLTPPTRTRGGGKGKRLSYRYPMGGIPGAPARDGQGQQQPLHGHPRLAELGHELRVLSLRVWLAGLPASAKRTQRAYASSRSSHGGVSVGTLIRHGGFDRFKALATAENEGVRRAGGDPLADALQAAERVRAEVEAIYAAGAPAQPEPVPFGEALRAVLSGPKAEVQAPRQS